MTTDIYTFSGTGNSLHVARELQRRLPESNLVPIVRLLGQETIKTRADTVGLVFPSFLVTGVLAVLVGLAVTAWSVAHAHKKHGGAVLMVLSTILWPVGGSLAPPIFLGVPASLTATRIGKPLRFWRRVLPGSLRGFLSGIWLGSLVAFVLCVVLSVVIVISGWPLTAFLNADTAFEVLNVFAFT